MRQISGRAVGTESCHDGLVCLGVLLNLVESVALAVLEQMSCRNTRRSDGDSPALDGVVCFKVVDKDRQRTLHLYGINRYVDLLGALKFGRHYNTPCTFPIGAVKVGLHTVGKVFHATVETELRQPREVELIIVKHYVEEVAPCQLVCKRVELDVLILERVSFRISGRGLDFAGVVVYLKPLITIDDIVAYLEVDRRGRLDSDGHIAFTHPLAVVFKRIDGSL